MDGEVVKPAIPSAARSKQLRACLLCSIIQMPREFKEYGCPNCEELMQVRSRAVYNMNLNTPR